MAAVSASFSETIAAQAWRSLGQAATAEQLCAAWLEVLVNALVQGRAGLVLLAQPDGSFAPVAALPAERDLSYLSEIATEALRSREGVVRSDELGHARLAYPLELRDALAGAVVLDLGPADAAALERALRLTHWGAGWLLDLLRQRESGQALASLQQGRFVLDTLLALQNERSEREAALALVNRVAREFGCHQVQLAVSRGKKTLKTLALSHAAVFDERAGAVNLAAQAMHEAFDQRQRIVWPVVDGAQGASQVSPQAASQAPSQASSAAASVGSSVASSQVSVAHRRYADESGAGALLSVPLIGVDRVAGVLLLERDRAFTAAEADYVDTLALALGSLLELQREAGQGAVARSLRTARRWLGWATDGGHPAIKLGVGAVALLLVLLAIIPAPFRISAQALVEGSVQRSVVAPFEGFLRDAPARAGDTVKAGQLLARLEDKDLLLEKVRWESELEVALRKERDAMAKGNRVDQRLAAAQANQARAQLDLVLGKIARVLVTAPFDGIVVKGDLSQQLGSPLELGKVLYELAPLDSWRVILKVDERDIGHVQVGASGELVLASLPGQNTAFTVKKLTPVSVAEEGRNYFRVEAELQPGAPKLSPNMEGVGKIDAGRASLLWAWSRPLVDWARLAWWKLMP